MPKKAETKTKEVKKKPAALKKEAAVKDVKTEKKTAKVAKATPSTVKSETKIDLPKDTSDHEIFEGIEEGPKEKAEIYDELIAQEMEREIIRSQRKQTAGRDVHKKEFKKFIPLQAQQAAGDRVVEIPEVITVKEFAEKTGLGAAKVIGELMKNGILANINQQIDYDTAQIIADDLKIEEEDW